MQCQNLTGYNLLGASQRPQAVTMQLLQRASVCTGEGFLPHLSTAQSTHGSSMVRTSAHDRQGVHHVVRPCVCNWPASSTLIATTGGVVLYALGVAYMILGLVIINNHYFMPSLRLLSHKLRLTDDVAGGRTSQQRCALQSLLVQGLLSSSARAPALERII
jgi:hypothetical protein